MKPTPEQVEARYEAHYDPIGGPHWVTREAATGQYVAYHYIQEAADRLTAKLNALEAAEQDSARLATAIDEAIDNASGRWCEWGERAEESFRILRAARKAQP